MFDLKQAPNGYYICESKKLVNGLSKVAGYFWHDECGNYSGNFPSKDLCFNDLLSFAEIKNNESKGS